MMKHQITKRSPLAVLLILTSTLPAQQGGPSPMPTPAMQATIDKDISRHFGDSPADPGPLATDLSPALTPAAIDAATRKVADWQLARAEPFFDRIWTWSALYSGFMAASDSTGDAKYRDAMQAMGEKFHWELRNRLPNADDQSVAQTYLELFLHGNKADSALIAPTRADLDSLIGLDTLTATDPRIPWWWCDALFMAPPAWARMYAATGERKYIDYLDRQWLRTSALLYDREEHLYARDASYIPKREANGKKIFWSRGEGWVMGGLARTLQFLPKDDPQRPFYINQLREMSARLAELQSPDGLWHAGLLDPAHYPEPEISGSALMVYGMAWGMNEGVLDPAVYRPVVEKAWRGILGHLYADGRLGDIQQTGAEPAFYLPGASYTYGVGGFLLAASELKKMSLGTTGSAAAAGSTAAVPPESYVDKTTGHRVIRLTSEPGSTGFYFNNNAYSPDGSMMIYTAPDGIHVLDLATRKTRLLVPNPPHSAGDALDPAARYRGNVHAIVVGHKTPSVFFTKADPDGKTNTIYKADMHTGAVTRLATLPPGATGVATVNADETLAAGTMNDGPPVAPEYGANQVSPTGTPRRQAPTGAGSGTLVQPEGKGAMMERRLASRQPLILFTINLQTGKLATLLHSTDWVNHLLFSPADPTLLMYCHEGPWQKVDRIWTIHTDGTGNTLIHKRTFAQEIAGHEFWGIDGKTIWYDWQPIKGEDFYLAGYDVATHRRRAFHMERNEWSIHFNVTKDESLFTGDGGDPGQVAKAPDGEYIELFHPEMKKVDGINQPDFIQPGMFRAEHLVNMAKHNYKLEPNVRFSPDSKLVIFTSNMFGPSYVFGVEVEKTAAGK